MEVLGRIENSILKFQFIDGFTLKIIALITMTIDHVGAIIFPDVIILRIIGRIAFPIFGYLIAEGCFYTRSRRKYFLSVFTVGAFCQVIFYIFQKSFYQCVLITFSLSIILICLFDYIIKKKNVLWTVIGILSIVFVYFASEILPEITNKVFDIDYGFWGIVLPLAVYLPNYFKSGRNIFKYIFFCGCLAALTFYMDINCQIYAFLSLIFIVLYNGRRGKAKLKYFFYVYYPVHLGIIYLISLL